MKAKIYVGLSLDRSQSTQSSGNRGRGARDDEKSSKMSVQLKDTQPSIWNPERNTTHASVVARDLGRARRLINAAPPGVKVSCEFASASSGDE
jgi:hypothetical protein